MRRHLHIIHEIKSDGKLLVVDIITLRKVSAKNPKALACATRTSGHPSIPEQSRAGKFAARKKTNLLPVGHFDLSAEWVIANRCESTVFLGLNF